MNPIKNAIEVITIKFKFKIMKEKKNSSDKNASEPKEVATKDEIQEDFIERLENKNDGKLITFDDVKEYSPELGRWLESIAKYGNVDKTMIIMESNEDSRNRGVKTIDICFYTTDHVYSITAIKINKEDLGYLGCIASTRKARVGEWWTRGSDLPDGKFNSHTWKSIVNRIVSYEIKNLQIDKTKK